MSDGVRKYRGFLKKKKEKKKFSLPEWRVEMKDGLDRRGYK